VFPTVHPIHFPPPDPASHAIQTVTVPPVQGAASINAQVVLQIDLFSQTDGVYLPAASHSFSTPHSVCQSCDSSCSSCSGLGPSNCLACSSSTQEAVRIYNVLYIYVLKLKRVYFQDLQRDDLIVKFGQLDESSFKSNSLRPLADLVAENEHVQVSISSLLLTRQSNNGANESSDLSRYESFVPIRQSS
jgi:hypothetical protein